MRPSLIMILCCVFMIMTSGCIKSVKQDHVSYHPQDLQAIQLDCEQIEKEPSIFQLLKEMKENNEEIFSLLELADPRMEEGRIEELAHGIKLIGEAISRQIKTSWSVSKWKQEIEWRIQKRDLATINPKLPTGFEILDIQVDSVYFMGELRNDLKSQILATIENGEVVVKFQGVASSLEVCSLQKTMGIILAVRFRNLWTIKMQYLNLNV
jgi:hypothetical protein